MQIKKKTRKAYTKSKYKINYDPFYYIDFALFSRPLNRTITDFILLHNRTNQPTFMRCDLLKKRKL
ncbi:hypothetical protein QTP88_000214 [Uroleucon formosanum]